MRAVIARWRASSSAWKKPSARSWSIALKEARWDPDEEVDAGFAKVLEQLVGWVAPIKDEHIIALQACEHSVQVLALAGDVTGNFKIDRSARAHVHQYAEQRLRTVTAGRHAKGICELVATLEIELGPVGCEDTAALPQPPGGIIVRTSRRGYLVEEFAEESWCDLMARFAKRRRAAE